MSTNTFNVRELPSIFGMHIEQEWLVEGLIPINSVIMISGESGGGKSTFTLALAKAISTGTKFLGKEVQKRPVLILDRENGLPVYTERIKRLDIEENPDLLVWGLFSGVATPEKGDLTLREFVEREKPLLIFDSFVAFHPGNEQDATETRNYMNWYRELAANGATVIVIHHTGKGENTKDYRGSSDIKASLDVGLTLTAKKPLLKLLQLRPFKTREGVLDPINVGLEGAEFVPIATEFVEPSDPLWKLVEAAVAASPALKQADYIKLFPDAPVGKIRKILLTGETNGTFRTEKGLHNATFYYPGNGKNAR